MRTPRLPWLCALAVLCFSSPSWSQIRRPSRFGTTPQSSGIVFNRAWDQPLDQPVELIEVGPTIEQEKVNLLMLVGGSDRMDRSRKLVITHWDGFKFAVDFSGDMESRGLDALVVGRFRTLPGPETASDTPSVRPASPFSIVTARGVWEWNGKTYAPVLRAPPDVKLGVVFDTMPGQLLSGSGEKCYVYELGDRDIRRSTREVPITGEGFVDFAVGSQDYSGSDGLTFGPNARYAQSFWRGTHRWVIGVIRGRPAGIADAPAISAGDRIVVFGPKAQDRTKSFWSLAMRDLVELWRSDPLPGHVLDVRVGDPKVEGKTGILVLMEDVNKKQQRHLQFFVPAAANGSNSQ
jgi:hypothetical protein